MMYDYVLQDEDGNDINVQAELKRIPVKAEPLFDNYLGNWYTTADQSQFGGDLRLGNIKNLALSYGMKQLLTDLHSPGSNDLKKVKLDATNPYDSLPDLRDDEGEYGKEGDSIGDVIIRTLVNSKANKFLAQKDMYRMVFGRYLDAEEEPKDPTEATSTNGSSATSLMVAPPKAE